MPKYWDVVAAERLALADDLEALDLAQWDTPSWCEAWSIHDVLAHVVDTASTGKLRFISDVLRSRFDFHRANELGIARERHNDPRVCVDRLRDLAHQTTSPPAPHATRLIEAFVHGEDIRRPLGIAHDYPSYAVSVALRSQAQTSTAMGGGRDYLKGLRLVATDCELIVGDGEEVRGRSIDLLLAAAGRRPVLTELDGAGLRLLGERLPR